jgi:hypothetical protein
MISRLPITAMTPGRDYWAVPWALTMDTGGDCHLSSCVEVHEELVGTSVCLRVRREPDGLHVHIDRRLHDGSDYRWSAEPDDGSAWFDLPVAAVWVDGVRLSRATLPPTLVLRDRAVAA